MVTITKIAGEELPRPAHYERRQWVRCSSCGRVGYYDYMPRSLSNPIMALGCGHDFGYAKRISAADAVSAIHAFRSH